MENTFEPSPYRKKQRRKLFFLCLFIFLFIYAITYVVFAMYLGTFTLHLWPKGMIIFHGALNGFSLWAIERFYKNLR